MSNAINFDIHTLERQFNALIAKEIPLPKTERTTLALRQIQWVFISLPHG
jgi:hypothetical protein